MERNRGPLNLGACAVMQWGERSGMYDPKGTVPDWSSQLASYRPCCDTLVIRDSVIFTKYRTRVDTLVQVVARDSIREIPVEVLRIEKERFIPWYYRYPAMAFYFLLGVYIVVFALRIYLRWHGL